KEIVGEEATSKENAGEVVTAKETTKGILLKVIQRQPEVTVKELASIIGLTNGSVRYSIEKLRKEGILSREGSTKAGRWIIN
ncbi:MAG: winged helix-turn-helix transcriptional regulator, partial [Clostridia bacterium]|nr:winged helix-turn-helix transcriptional regulator [Clostridia bacterium]